MKKWRIRSRQFIIFHVKIILLKMMNIITSLILSSKTFKLWNLVSLMILSHVSNQYLDQFESDMSQALGKCLAKVFRPSYTLVDRPTEKTSNEELEEMTSRPLYVLFRFLCEGKHFKFHNYFHQIIFRVTKSHSVTNKSFEPYCQPTGQFYSYDMI